MQLFSNLLAPISVDAQVMKVGLLQKIGYLSLDFSRDSNVYQCIIDQTNFEGGDLT